MVKLESTASDKGGRGNWVFPRVGNYSKPRVLKERAETKELARAKRGR
jgi:hypothetical protein